MARWKDLCILHMSLNCRIISLTFVPSEHLGIVSKLFNLFINLNNIKRNIHFDFSLDVLG
jgi:hypothetical protein